LTNRLCCGIISPVFGRGAFCNQYLADIIASTSVMPQVKGAGAEGGNVKDRIRLGEIRFIRLSCHMARRAIRIVFLVLGNIILIAYHKAIIFSFIGNLSFLKKFCF